MENEGNPEDYLEFVGGASDTGEGDSLARLRDLAAAQFRAEQEVAAATAELARKEAALKEIAERQIPDLMDAIGVKEFSTLSGLHVRLKETIRASIPKERAGEAFTWLRENGHAALITRELTVAFGRGEDEQAEAFAQYLEAQHLEASDRTSVHASTLSAFVRRELEDGRDVPQDLLGVHRQRESKIELPAVKRARR